jgi:chloride channel 3/4/5
MDLIYEVFSKLGLRYVCVLRDGQFAGLVNNSLSVEI